jgi:acetamidase/formamidase
MALHRIEPHRETLHGSFSPQWEPALRIDPGDSVVFKTLDARWTVQPPPDQLHAGIQFAPKDPIRDNGHALCGPIAINGAEPGMILVVHIGGIVTGTYGWTIGGGWVNGINDRLGVDKDEVRLGWNLDPDRGIATDQFGHSVRMAPFFGVMGMPAASDDPIPSWTPRAQGGNIDCKELVSGTTLYLPIAVPGALFSAGDGHARQGDGEVSGVAIECPFESATLTFDLRDDLALLTPIARTADSWITFGFHENLDEATLIALEGMMNLFGREFGIPRNQAMALCSVVVDLRITQIVNGVRGVHAVLRDGEIF